MDPWGIVSLAGLVASVAVALYIVVRVPRTPTRLPFALLMVAFAVWDLGEAAARLVPAADPADLLPWIRFQWIGISLTSGTFLHFALNFSRGRPLRERPWEVPVVYAVSVVVSSLVVTTDAIVAGVGASPTGPVARLAPGYALGALWYEGWFAATFVILARAYFRAPSPEFRRRSAPVVLVLAVAGVLASATETLWPLYTASPGNLGLASIYMLMITVGASFSEVRFRFLEVRAVTEVAPPGVRFGLRPGASYLFLSRARAPALIAFRELVASTPGLCITGAYPRKLQVEFGLERTPILWITAAAGADLSLRPKTLEFEVLHTVSRFVKGNPSTVVLVDDLDLLAHTNGFEAVCRFLHRVNNLSTGRGSTTIAAADPEAFTAGPLALLRGLFDEVREVAPPIAFLEPPPPAGPGTVLIEGDAEAALSLYESLEADGRGLVVTTKHPARLRGRLGPAARIVWVAGAGESVEDGPAPVAIDLEAGSLAAGFLRYRERPVVYVADIEQFRLFAPFPRVLEFVKGLIDQVSVRDGILIGSVEPRAVEPTELTSLRRRFDRVRSL